MKVVRKTFMFEGMIKEFTKLLVVFTLTFSRSFNDFICALLDIDVELPLLFSWKSNFHQFVLNWCQNKK